MFGKNLWVFGVLFLVASLIATGFVGAANTQAAEPESRATEKISGKIAGYKIKHTDLNKRLDNPVEPLSCVHAPLVNASEQIGGKYKIMILEIKHPDSNKKSDNSGRWGWLKKAVKYVGSACDYVYDHGSYYGKIAGNYVYHYGSYYGGIAWNNMYEFGCGYKAGTKDSFGFDKAWDWHNAQGETTSYFVGYSIGGLVGSFLDYYPYCV